MRRIFPLFCFALLLAGMAVALPFSAQDRQRVAHLEREIAAIRHGMPKLAGSAPDLSPELSAERIVASRELLVRYLLASKGEPGPDLRTHGDLKQLRQTLSELEKLGSDRRRTVAKGSPETGITGTITDAQTGQPIADDLFVVLFDGAGELLDLELTDEAGSYTFEGLSAGTYFVATSFADYFDELFDDLPCPFSCTVTSGTPISVTAGSVTSGIDFALARGGAISGTITDVTTGQPIADEIFVVLYDAAGELLSLGFTDEDGFYTFAGLPTGTYFVATSFSDYFDEVYDDLPCPFSCDVTDGTPISVTFGSTTSGIDLALDPGGIITGTITEEGTGQPIAFEIFVVLWDAAGDLVGLGFTDEDGSYTFAGLPSGTYHVSTLFDDYFDELYDDIPCPDDCDVTAGTPISVTFGQTTSGIDFVLSRGGVITGTVIDAGTGLPVADDGFMVLYDSGGDFLNLEFTDENGTYTFAGLPTGTYFATAEIDGFPYEVYDDVPCPDDDCNVTAGTPIPVTFGQATSGIDFALGEPGDLPTLTVTRAGTGTGTVTSAPAGIDCGADCSEDYPLGTLVSLQAMAGAGSTFVGWGGGACSGAGACVVTMSADVNVTATFDSTGEGTCGGAICLNADRFQIDVDWRTGDGGVGQAQAVPGVRSDDSGVLYFFTANNWEMLIKVLDGCGITDHFWVFAAATTDVEYTLTVTDTQTAASKSYFNPLGNAAASITDTSALAVCDSGVAAESPKTAIQAVAPSRTYVDELAKQGTCAAGTDRLCLGQSRFQVEVDWRTGSDEGSGQVVPFGADDSGLFYFFTAANWEMLVKVLDGCAITDHFWVFAAATTDVGYTLKVTDTENGAVKEYTNPIGRAAPAITDTSAFATCP